MFSNDCLLSPKLKKSSKPRKSQLKLTSIIAHLPSSDLTGHHIGIRPFTRVQGGWECHPFGSVPSNTHSLSCVLHSWRQIGVFSYSPSTCIFSTAFLCVCSYTYVFRGEEIENVCFYFNISKSISLDNFLKLTYIEQSLQYQVYMIINL